MDAAALDSLHTTVLWAAFAVAVAFGFISQRTHFCTMGALSDAFNFGDLNRLRMWVMAIGVAAIGFHALVWLGWIDAGAALYTGPRVMWLSAVVGGLLFGFGMVLASGCGGKTLVRIGAGSLRALVVFVVMGVAAFMTLRGLFGVWRVNTVDRAVLEFDGAATLAGWMGRAAGGDAGTLAAVALGLALIGWALASRDFRTGNNLLAGAGIGLCIVAMWWVSGRLGFVAEHPETLEAVYLGSTTGRMESLSFSAPMATTLDWLMFYSDRAKVLTFGVVTVVGVVVGSAVCALWERSFRWEGLNGTRDTALHLVGGVCMGAGGVTALGCTVGQGLSGLSTLSLMSAVAVAAIVAGAWLGFRFQMWLLERE